MFENFEKPTKEDWIETLKKELKGADFDSSLIKYDEIEKITYPSFFHGEDMDLKTEVPGKYPYRRGFYTSLSDTEANDWSIVSLVEVLNEKRANEKALDALMRGSTAIYFKISTKTFNLDELLKNIECQYIKIYFEIQDTTHLTLISDYFNKNICDEILISYNPLHQTSSLVKDDLVEIKNGITRNFEIDAYSIQQAGANCSQELAFALSLGHEYLIQQINLGRSVDEALVNMHFTFGVGSSYLVEIAKFRAFRILWSKIARSYQPEHRCNETVSITAKTGFLNKSLKDPYTNLLRQTTEVMSAVLGGANHIMNQAYDTCSMEGVSDFAGRMAVNISLILKEESYLNQVLDAVGGSYAIEQLTEQLADKSWELFQQVESQGGLVSSDLMGQITKTAEKRIELYENKRKTLIGINKFPDTGSNELSWKTDESEYFGLKRLIIENELS